MIELDREIFEKAWSANIASCRRTCACGKVFWDSANTGYTWERGEREALENDPNAESLPYAVSILWIEGNEYVADCNCWVDRAKAIWVWVDRHGHQLAKMINLKKRKAMVDAERMPEVES